MKLIEKVILFTALVFPLSLVSGSLVQAGCSDKEYLEAERIYEEALQETAIDKRMNLFEKAFEVCPSHGNHAQGYYLLGKFYYEVGQKDKALAWLVEANRFRSVLLQRSAKDLADVNCHLGKLYQAGGDLENALIHFNMCKSLKNYPDERLERDLIENAPSLLALVYTPGTVKEILSPIGELSSEDRAKVNRLEVYFDLDTAILGPKTKESLDAVGQALQSDALKDCLIVIEGHTDGTGDPAYNCALGARRAQAVSDYLKEKWLIKGNLIHSISFGQSKQAVTRKGHPRTQWQDVDKLNRRVVIWSWGIVEGDAKRPELESLGRLSPCR